MIDPERIKLVPTCEACREHYDAYLDEWSVGYLRLRHSWFTVSFPGPCGELLHNDRVGGGANLKDDERENHLAHARRLIAERLDRSSLFQLGQRVRYHLPLGGARAAGEGTIVRLPRPGAYCPADLRYRVRHDGGTSTDYVEVGVLEHELTSMDLGSACAELLGDE